MSRPDLDSDIQRMTTYCTYCPKMCRFTCPTAGAEARETATPWAMMRLLELSRDGTVALDENVADTFYHCTGCRRCQRFCAHDNDVPRALWKARQWVAQSGYLPEAYRDLQSRFESEHTPYPNPDESDPFDKIDISAFHETATIAFWPDCSTVRHRPHTIAPVARLLARITGQKIRLILSQKNTGVPCCGFPLSAAGIDSPQRVREKYWPSLQGIQQIWTDCPALAAWHHRDSSWPLTPREDDPGIDHIFNLLAERLPHLPAPPSPLDLGQSTLHESCFVARQIDALDAVHAILSHICTVPPKKMAYHDKQSPCCGGRVQYRILDPDSSHDAAHLLLRSFAPDQQSVMTTSSMCRHALQQADEQRLISSLLERVCQAYDYL